MPAGLSTIQEIMEEARSGRPFILVDADNRENEGDLVIPAQFATPEVINFMARYGRGLICLALSGSRACELNLSPMATRNGSKHGTAFTASIEARVGVTTGISAFDRARTIAVAVDATMGAGDIVSPGHIFPLIARDGGVLARAGHTEAAVDVSRIAGLTPAGVICEIMNDDGTMSRLPELLVFAKLHGLKIGTIADLIEYRRTREILVEEVHEGAFACPFGDDFRAHVFRSIVDGSEHLALVRGVIRSGDETLVRVHRVNMMTDLLGFQEDRRDIVGQAMRVIARHVGPAVIVFVRDSDPAPVQERITANDTQPCAEHISLDYGVGAQVLKALGASTIRILTSSTTNIAAIEAFGLQVVGKVPFVQEHHIELPRDAVGLRKAS